MFEEKLRKAVQHFGYSQAMNVWGDVNKAELHQRYQVTDAEDALYWELDAMIVKHQDKQGNKQGVQRGDVVKVYE